MIKNHDVNHSNFQSYTPWIYKLEQFVYEIDRCIFRLRVFKIEVLVKDENKIPIIIQFFMVKRKGRYHKNFFETKRCNVYFKTSNMTPVMIIGTELDDDYCEIKMNV